MSSDIAKMIDDLSGKIDTRSAEDKKQIDSLKTLSTELQTQVKELEGKLVTLKGGLGVSLPGIEDEKQKFSFQRSFFAILNNDWSEAGYEKEVFAQTQKRAVQQASTDALGGFLVPIQISSELIDTLRNELIVSSLGCRVLSNLPSGIYDFNKKKTNAAAQPKSEIGVSQRTSVEFNQMRLTPHMISAYVPMSERILRATNGAIETIIREDLRLALLERLEAGFFFGNGTNNDVIGLANMAGVLGAKNTGENAGDKHVYNADAADGHRLTFDDVILKLEQILSDNNALPRNAKTVGLATNPGVKRLLRTEKYWTYDNTATPTNANLPYRQNMPMTDAEVSARLGYDITTSNIIPISGANQGVYTGTYDTPATGTKKLAYGFWGNWAEVMLALYAGMAIRASRDASDVVGGKFFSAFTQNQVWLRADMEYDVGLRHDESMVILNNLKTR